MRGDLSIGVHRREVVVSADPTVAGFAAGLRTVASGLRQSIAQGTIFLPLIAIALWALTHSFQGILGDAKVYMGRALADLDPAGVGRDMMFVHDGQSRFSLFPVLLDHLVAAFGTQSTAVMLALLSMAAWIAALCALARQFVATRLIFVVVIFVALLPDSYGAPSRFIYSEVLAVPRPFAEAIVLGAIAALAAGRSSLAFFCLIAASLVHPIMALAGWGVFALVLCREDWRWRVVVALAVVLVFAGAVLGVPVLDRLLAFMDADLRAFAEHRSPHLFPTDWPVESIGPVLIQATTIAIAASFFEGRRRVILLAAIPVGIGGIAVQALFGDHFSVLLVIQAQPWRMAWLLAAIGTASLAICALELWQKGPRGHVVLAILAVAWLSSDAWISAAIICAVALAVRFGERNIRLPMTWPIARAVWACAFAVALFWNAHYFINYGSFLATFPSDRPFGISYFWNRRYLAFPLLALVLALAFARRPSHPLWGAQCAVTLLLILAVIRFWDERPPFQRMLDANVHPPELMALIASRSGEVLWIDGLVEAWFLTGRPQWASPQQGVGSLFSRDLALKWRERMQFLLMEGLAEKNALITGHVPAAADLPGLPRDGMARLCARADAPAWVITPVWEGTVIPPEFRPHYWQLAVPNFEMTEETDSYAWHQILAYAVLPCAGAVASN